MTKFRACVLPGDPTERHPMNQAQILNSDVLDILLDIIFRNSGAKLMVRIQCFFLIHKKADLKLETMVESSSYVVPLRYHTKWTRDKVQRTQPQVSLASHCSVDSGFRVEYKS